MSSGWLVPKGGAPWGTTPHRRVARFGAVVLAVAVLGLAPTAPSGADGGDAPGAPAAYRSLSAGQAHTCVITGAGQVKCWGLNNWGQLGLGDTFTRGNEPDEVGLNLPSANLGSGRTATAVAAGALFTCALLDNGTVKCWGRNDSGQLGLGDTAPRGDAPGELGDNLPAVSLGTGATATAIATGYAHACALLGDGRVKCWGYNGAGELGIGTTGARGDGPGELGDSLPAVDLGTGRTATAITAGDNHTCALLDDATIKCWGSGLSGRLGLGSTSSRGTSAADMGDNLPTVSLGTGRTATAVSAGGNHTCALLDDSSVKCWGSGNSGRLGLGDSVTRGDAPGEMGDNLPAVALGTGRNATAISAGGDFTCAVLDDATVKCWGSPIALGQGDATARGDSPGEMGDNLPPIALGTGRTVDAISTGSFHVCARLDDGSIKCWGTNTDAQLGNGDVFSRGRAAHQMGDALPVSFLLGPALAGHVTGTTVGPLAETLVLALTTTDHSIVAAGTTTPGGEFGFPVPPGSYLLYAIEPTLSFTAGLLGGGSPTVVSVGAVPVIANPQLGPALGAIAGTVSESGTGTPLPGASALALTPTGTLEASTSADGAGHYLFGRLTPGPHHLAFLDPTGAHATRFHSNATNLGAATAVTVIAGTAATADETLPTQPPVGTGRSLFGHVTEAGTGRPLAGVLVVALRASTFGFARATHTNAQGGYLLDLAAGTYVVGFLDPTALHANEWYANQPLSSLGAAAPVAAPGVADAALDHRTGSMSGTVSRSAEPAAGAWVLALGPTGLAATATADDAGDWRIDGLAPGTYRVATLDVPRAHLEFWMDATTFGDAVPVTVLAGHDAPVDAHV